LWLYDAFSPGVVICVYSQLFVRQINARAISAFFTSALGNEYFRSTCKWAFVVREKIFWFPINSDYESFSQKIIDGNFIIMSLYYKNIIMCTNVYNRIKELCIIHNFGEPPGGCCQNHKLRHSRFNKRVRIETKETPVY